MFNEVSHYHYRQFVVFNFQINFKLNGRFALFEGYQNSLEILRQSTNVFSRSIFSYGHGNHFPSNDLNGCLFEIK